MRANTPVRSTVAPTDSHAPDVLTDELVAQIRARVEGADEPVSVPAMLGEFVLPPTAADAVAELLDRPATVDVPRGGGSA